jgi:hypothetical protein
VSAAYGGDTLHRRLKTDLSQASLDALADFSAFLFERGFIPTRVEVGQWIDAGPFEAIREQARAAA